MRGAEEESGAVLAREMTGIEMVVRNNSAEAVRMSLGVTCHDVTGASCLGPSGSKATVLWAGTLNGVEVEVPPWGEVVHKFALCFLVPGEYTLVGASILHPPSESSNLVAATPFKLWSRLGQQSQAGGEGEAQAHYCSGLPFKVWVEGQE